MQVEDALERFIIQLQADGRSAHTQAQYTRHVRQLARWLATEGRSSAVEDIDHETLALFLADANTRSRPDGRPKKATSMNCLRSSLRTFFRYIHEAGQVDRNSARLVRLAWCGTPPPKALTDDEQRRLLDVLAAAEGPLAERDHLLFHLMLATGIRIGSALALDVEDVDLDQGELTLRGSKYDRVERVFLGPEIVIHLRRCVRGIGEGPLFRARGHRLGTRQTQRRIRTWCELAGVDRKVSPHTFRHCFATRLYDRTGDIGLVRAALHHRSIASTLMYAQAAPEAVRQAMEDVRPQLRKAQ